MWLKLTVNSTGVKFLLQTHKMNSNLSVELVLEFIKSHGGKVKNSVLVPHFKKFFNDPATKGLVFENVLTNKVY